MLSSTDVKENLVLIPGFGTNCQMLCNLIRFLNQDFHVYCIDLPGFSKKHKTLSNHSLSEYAKHVEKQIKELHLPHFLLAGISFGFAITQHMHLDRNCKGIIAVFPYLGIQVLKLPSITIYFFSLLLHLLIKFNFHNLLWKVPIFQRYMQNSMSTHLYNIMIGEIDPLSYFTAAKIIFSLKTKSIKTHLPYFVFASEIDEIIDYKKLVSVFSKVSRKIIIKLPLKHFPKELNENSIGKYLKNDYFRMLKHFFLLNTASS